MKLWQMGLLAMLILITAGCSASDQESVQDSASPSSEVTQSPTAAQPFDQPLVSAKAGEQGKKEAESDLGKLSLNKIPGLLQSTDPDERAKQVQASIGKKPLIDPFASLPPNLTLKTPIEPAGTKAAPAGFPGSTTALPESKGGRSLPSLPAFPKSIEIRPPAIALSPPGAPGKAGPGGKAGLSPLPALPKPTLAREVEVTGVVTFGGTARAIVKAPKEPTSRYVTVGQRLSNGQVLVKRIEVNSGSDPIVILEENGVEVARAVGDKPKPPAASVSS